MKSEVDAACTAMASTIQLFKLTYRVLRFRVRMQIQQDRTLVDDIGIAGRFAGCLSGNECVPA